MLRRNSFSFFLSELLTRACCKLAFNPRLWDPSEFLQRSTAQQPCHYKPIIPTEDSNSITHSGRPKAPNEEERVENNDRTYEFACLPNKKKGLKGGFCPMARDTFGVSPHQGGIRKVIDHSGFGTSRYPNTRKTQSLYESRDIEQTLRFIIIIE